MTFFTHSNEALDTLDDIAAVAAARPLAGDHAPDLYNTDLDTRPDVSHARRLAAIMTDQYPVASIRLAKRNEPEDRGLVPIESHGSRAAYGDMVTFACLRLDVTEVAGRWADIEAAVDAGHEVRLLRGGEPWAMITPA
jgi:hypothetical protein